MTLPYQEHNSLIATREFLSILCNSDEIPEKFRENARYLLKYYPYRDKLDKLYEGNTFSDFMNPPKQENSNKIVNDNQTWKTPGFKWKTEVEFVSKENH